MVGLCRCPKRRTAPACDLLCSPPGAAHKRQMGWKAGRQPACRDRSVEADSSIKTQTTSAAGWNALARLAQLHPQLPHLFVKFAETLLKPLHKQRPCHCQIGVAMHSHTVQAIMELVTLVVRPVLNNQRRIINLTHTANLRFSPFCRHALWPVDFRGALGGPSVPACLPTVSELQHGQERQANPAQDIPRRFVGSGPQGLLRPRRLPGGDRHSANGGDAPMVGMADLHRAGRSHPAARVIRRTR